MGISVVTGCAGFIGSHLVAKLIKAGEVVIGIDCFLDDSYASELKRRNLALIPENSDFTFYNFDLRDVTPEVLTRALSGANVIFHLAAMPGLSPSWESTKLYIDCNVVGTQSLIDSFDRVSLRHFIYVSTSSVYGLEAIGNELSPLKPISPYGVTKLAAEEMLSAYSRSDSLPLTILRYFSVYGPRQRPDMAYSKFIHSMLEGSPISIFGDGKQSRSNTFVGDVVDATYLASTLEPNGSIYNIGGSEKIELLNAVKQIANYLEIEPILHMLPVKKGDQRHTFADTTKFSKLTGFKFQTNFETGILEQIKWTKAYLVAQGLKL